MDNKRMRHADAKSIVDDLLAAHQAPAPPPPPAPAVQQTGAVNVVVSGGNARISVCPPHAMEPSRE